MTASLEPLTIEALVGAAAAPCFDDLARLRIAVFREFPYLYEGSLEYEQQYLQSYARCDRSVIVVARDTARSGAPVVGASTAMPLTEHGEELAPVIAAAGIDPGSVYYFGESVLLPEYRGRGIGHAFFDEREAIARRLGYSLTAFCAVIRAEDHPLRPKDYVTHDAFWTKRGYTRRGDLLVRFAWRDLGQAQPTDKPMVFWIKDLGI